MGQFSAAIDRRQLVSSLTGAGLGWLAAASAFGGSANLQPQSVDLITPAGRRAVKRGLGYLASRQNSDGSFGAEAYKPYVGICGLAGMAFMASGNTPGQGTYGRQVSRCVQHVLLNMRDSGIIASLGGAGHGPMYGHGFATLFLAEVYGLAPDPELRARLTRAVRLIVETQNADGGWRYQAVRDDADLSVTICEMMALRAARNAGITVPDETIDRCISFVKRSQNPDGGFMYMLTGGPSAFPRSAAGLVALFSAGVHEGDEIDRGLAYLSQFAPSAGRRDDEQHFFYAHYYAVQAMWYAGGNRWKQWYAAIRDVLVMRQSENGSWKSGLGSEYGTAMATIILQMPNNYLPIFQQ